MIRPTRRAVLLVGAAPVVALVAIAVDERLWPLGAAYLAIALLALLADGWLAMPPGALEVTIGDIATLQIGEAAALEIALACPTRYPAAEIEAICEHDQLLTTAPMTRARFAPQPAIRLALPLAGRSRGQAELAALWLRWQGPWGLIRRQLRRPIEQRIRILPNVRRVHDQAIRLASWQALHGIKAQAQLGIGSEFDALRDHVPGLDRRGIDWKHSARHRRLIGKEYRAERNHQIIVALDTGHLMREPLAGIPKLDHAIGAGLLLGYSSLKAGDRVGLFGFDAKVRLFLEPLGGTQHFARLQHRAAELDYATEETNFTLALTDLMRRLSRRSLIVVITDFVDTVTAELMVENLAHLSTRHLVLLVALQDPELTATVTAEPQSLEIMARALVAAEFDHDRRVVFQRLRRLGVLCLEAPHQRIGAALIDRYLTIKQRELI